MNEKQSERYRRAHDRVVTPDELGVLVQTFVNHPGAAGPSFIAALESVGFIVERPIKVSEKACTEAASKLPMMVSPGEVERAVQAAIKVMLEEGTLKLSEGKSVQCRCPSGDCGHR